MSKIIYPKINGKPLTRQQKIDFNELRRQIESNFKNFIFNNKEYEFYDLKFVRKMQKVIAWNSAFFAIYKYRSSYKK